MSGLTPPIGDSEFSCIELGQTYHGALVVRPTPNPNFRNVEAQISDSTGVPVVQIKTVMPSK